MSVARVALSLLFLGACSESHVAHPDAAADSRTPDEVVEAFAEEWTEAYCEWAVRCEPVLRIPAASQSPYCHPHGQRLLQLQPALFVELWRAGYRGFDSEAAASCLERLRNGGCDSCWVEEAFVGLSGPGEDCTFGCAEGTHPELGAWGTPYACSSAACTCQPLRSEGESCEFDRQCAEGLFCDAASRCGQRAPLGASCRGTRSCPAGAVCIESECRAWPLGLGDACTELIDCRGDLVCTRDGELWGVCTTGEPEGGACDDDRPCTLHHRCEEDICRYIALPGDSCVGALCPHSFFCDEGTCAPQSLHGEPCSGPTSCAQGVCTDGTCTALEAGARCEPDEMFEFGSCVTGQCTISGVCRTLVGEGEPCADDRVVCSVNFDRVLGELYCETQEDCSQVCARFEL